MIVMEKAVEVTPFMRALPLAGLTKLDWTPGGGFTIGASGFRERRTADMAGRGFCEMQCMRALVRTSCALLEVCLTGLGRVNLEMERMKIKQEKEGWPIRRRLTAYIY